MTVAPVDGPARRRPHRSGQPPAASPRPICTEDAAAAAEFLGAWGGTGGFWNTTTRLLDGYRLLGVPETGISVDRVPGPRGPVTSADLVLRQYVVVPAGLRGAVRVSSTTTAPPARAVSLDDGPGRREAASASWAAPSTPSTTVTWSRPARSPRAYELDEVVFVPTGRPWQKSDREVSPAEHRYLMSGHRDGVEPAVLGQPGRHRPGRARPTPSTPCATSRGSARAPSCSSSPAPTPWRRSCPGRTPPPCWRVPPCTSIGVTRPGYELSKDTCPRLGDPARGAGDGHQLLRRPRPRRPSRPVWYLVPDGVVQYIGKHGLYRAGTDAAATHPPDRLGHRDRHRPRPRSRPGRCPGGGGQDRDRRRRHRRQ